MREAFEKQRIAASMVITLSSRGSALGQLSIVEPTAEREIVPTVPKKHNAPEGRHQVIWLGRPPWRTRPAERHRDRSAQGQSCRVGADNGDGGAWLASLDYLG